MAILRVILSLSIASIVSAATASDHPVSTVTKFPVGAYFVERHQDGTIACFGGDGVYLSNGNPRKWSGVKIMAAGLPRFNSYYGLGGDRDRVFLDAVSARDGSMRLISVDVGKRQSRIVRELPSRHAAFASKTVGVIADGTTLSLTTDGGETLSAGAVVSLKPRAELSALAWTNQSRLLVAGTDRTVQLFELDKNKTLNHRWTAAPATDLANRFTLDGEYVWAGTKKLRRLKLATGAVDATIEPDTEIRGSAAFQEGLFVWGFQAETVLIKHWVNVPGQGFLHRSDLECEGDVTAILRSSSTTFIVITAAGSGFLLDIAANTIKPTGLEIEPIPRPQIPARDLKIDGQ
jgi:hypothetical protein